MRKSNFPIVQEGLEIIDKLENGDHNLIDSSDLLIDAGEKFAMHLDARPDSPEKEKIKNILVTNLKRLFMRFQERKKLNAPELVKLIGIDCLLEEYVVELKDRDPFFHSLIENLIHNKGKQAKNTVKRVLDRMD